MNKFITATAAMLALVTPALAQPSGIWGHNGSTMRLTYLNGHFEVVYEDVRPGLRQTTPPGAPRFVGERVGDRITGLAFVHTKYCPGRSFPYPVSGVMFDETVIKLYGPAAIVDPNTCSIVGYKADSDNANVVFRLIQPDVPPPVFVPPPPPPVYVPPPPVVVPPQVVMPPVVVPSSTTSNNNNIVVPSGPVINNNVTIQTPTARFVPTAPSDRTDEAWDATRYPRRELSPDEQAEILKRQAEEFCWKFPGRPECKRHSDESQVRPADPLPRDAVPYEDK